MDDFPYTDEPLDPETQALLQQALKKVEEGKAYGPFKTAEEVQAYLDSLKKRS